MAAPTTRYRVVIVGGGPAGLATALRLAQQAPELAADTLILEAKDYPRPKLCGGGITVHGEELLQRLGIALDVTAFEVHRLVFRLGSLSFTVNHPHAMRIVERAEFDAALADAVRARGLRIQTGEPLLDVQPGPDGVTLHTARGRYQARVLVAADGANSTVRRKLRMFSTVGVARLLRVLTHVNPALDPVWRQQTAVFDFSCVRRGIQGYMWDFPCFLDGRACMNRGIFDSRIVPEVSSRRLNGHANGHANGRTGGRAGGRMYGHANGRTNGHAPATLKTLFAEGLQSRAVDLDAVPLEGHPVRWFNPDAEFARPHILLAGDAAGVDPLFAEGISYGMEYGGIVVDALEDAFRRGDFSFSDYRARLLNHRLGQLLKRRAAVARTLYAHRYPGLWSLLWRCAFVAPRRVQYHIGAYLALLPAYQTLGDR